MYDITQDGMCVRGGICVRYKTAMTYKVECAYALTQQSFALHLSRMQDDKNSSYVFALSFSGESAVEFI